MALENRDLLRDVVVENGKVALGERPHGVARGVFHRRDNAHQIDIHADVRLLSQSGERCRETNKTKVEKPAAHCGPTPLPPRLPRPQSTPFSKWGPAASA